MGTLIAESELQTALQSLPGWTRKGNAIERVFKFADFALAMRFVNRVADAAETANHHPDITINYNRVTMILISHDSGGVTQRDVRMAGKINEIAG